jgi:hypothetical protein
MRSLVRDDVERSRDAICVRALQIRGPPKTEGAGNAGCRNAPAALRAKMEEARTQVVTGTPVMPAFPARWFTAYTCSPRCAGLFSHRRARENVSQALTSASGGRDHTISLVRIGPPSSFASQSVHRIPASRFVTIGRNVPRVEAGCAEHAIDLVISAIPKWCDQ